MQLPNNCIQLKKTIHATKTTMDANRKLESLIHRENVFSSIFITVGKMFIDSAVCTFRSKQSPTQSWICLFLSSFKTRGAQLHYQKECTHADWIQQENNMHSTGPTVVVSESSKIRASTSTGWRGGVVWRWCGQPNHHGSGMTRTSGQSHTGWSSPPPMSRWSVLAG